MNREIFGMEMKRNFAYLAVWTIAVCALVFLTMSVFPVFIGNQKQLLGLMHLIPAAAMKFRGVARPEDLLSVLGFYAANNTIYMLLLGGIFSMALGAGILHKEEYGRTAEYLLSRPLTRDEIFGSKFSAMAAVITVLNLFAVLAGMIALHIYKKGQVDWGAFGTLSMYSYLLCLFFGCMGMLISVLARRPKPVTLQCIGLVLALYVVYTISRITATKSFLGLLSPFTYVNVSVTTPGYGPELWRVAVFAVTGAAMALAALEIYRKKDIYL